MIPSHSPGLGGSWREGSPESHLQFSGVSFGLERLKSLQGLFDSMIQSLEVTLA
jgi:hypothetical protein